MFYQYTNVEKTEILPLRDAKKQVGLTDSFTYDDAYLITLIEICTEYLQTLLPYQRIRPCTVKQEWQGVDLSSGNVMLRGGNVESITSFQVDGEDADYSFYQVSQQLVFDNETYTGHCLLEYQTGYSAEDLPKCVKLALQLLVADAYRNRESTVRGVSVSNAAITARQVLHDFDPVAGGTK